MIEFRPGAAVSLDQTRANFPSGSTDIASCSPVKPSAGNDRPVAPAAPAIPRSAAPAIPRSAAARAILVLAAKTAFELRDGTRNGAFAAQLEAQCESLAQTLEKAPAISKGADSSLMLRRARRALKSTEETIRREVLDKIDENTDMDEIKAALHAVKDAAVQTGKELKLLEIMASGI